MAFSAIDPEWYSTQEVSMQVKEIMTSNVECTQPGANFATRLG